MTGCHHVRMRLLPLCANPPAVVDAVVAAGFAAEMLHVQSPEFHIAVSVSPEEEAIALAAARRVDPEVQVLDS